MSTASRKAAGRPGGGCWGTPTRWGPGALAPGTAAILRGVAGPAPPPPPSSTSKRQRHTPPPPRSRLTRVGVLGDVVVARHWLAQAVLGDERRDIPVVYAIGRRQRGEIDWVSGGLLEEELA